MNNNEIEDRFVESIHATAFAKTLLTFKDQAPIPVDVMYRHSSDNLHWVVVRGQSYIDLRREQGYTTIITLRGVPPVSTVVATVPVRNRTERIKMTVDFDVTEPQALALQAMFKYWSQLSSQGSSRHVSFFVDGDGNFKPNINVSFNQPVAELTPEIEALAVVENTAGNRKYDFDPVAWHLRQQRDGNIAKFVDQLAELRAKGK